MQTVYFVKVDRRSTTKRTMFYVVLKRITTRWNCNRKELKNQYFQMFTIREDTCLLVEAQQL
jgi:hypothetical protein